MERSEDRSRIVPSLERATHAVGLRMEFSLKELGITQAEAHVLGALAEVGQCSINDLHASFGHKRSTLTSILDRLEGRGLIQRAPHPTSRRSVLIRLTDRGAEAARYVVGILESIEAAVVDRVNPDDLHGFFRVVAAIGDGDA